MAVGGEHADAAEGAAVVVGGDDGAAEALVAGGGARERGSRGAGERGSGLDGRGWGFFEGAGAGLGEELLAVVEGLDVDGGLGEEVGLDGRAEVGLDEGGAEEVAGFGGLEQGVEVVVEAGAEGEFLQ